MFRDVPGCSGMFRHVPECSVFLVLSTPVIQIFTNLMLSLLLLLSCSCPINLPNNNSIYISEFLCIIAIIFFSHLSAFEIPQPVRTNFRSTSELTHWQYVGHMADCKNVHSPQQTLDCRTLYLLIHIKKLNETSVNYFKVLLKTHFNNKPLVTNSLCCVFFVLFRYSEKHYSQASSSYPYIFNCTINKLTYLTFE